MTSSPLLAVVVMTSVTDLVAVLVRNVYDGIQKHEPLPTIVLALVGVFPDRLPLSSLKSL